MFSSFSPFYLDRACSLQRSSLGALKTSTGDRPKWTGGKILYWNQSRKENRGARRRHAVVLCKRTRGGLKALRASWEVSQWPGRMVQIHLKIKGWQKRPKDDYREVDDIRKRLLCHKLLRAHWYQNMCYCNQIRADFPGISSETLSEGQMWRSQRPELKRVDLLFQSALKWNEYK